MVGRVRKRLWFCAPRLTMSLLIDDLSIIDQRRRADGQRSNFILTDSSIRLQHSAESTLVRPHFEGAARKERIFLRPSTAHATCVGVVEEGRLLKGAGPIGGQRINAGAPPPDVEIQRRHGAE
jgi:hypothetical protein